MEQPEAQDAGTIILTGFDTEIVLSSVRTVIEEHINRTQTTQIEQINTDIISENQINQRYSYKNEVICMNNRWVAWSKAGNPGLVIPKFVGIT